MKSKNCLLLIILLPAGLLYGQTAENLPYKELPKHKFKKASITILASKMLDSVGHNFFWTTDNLIQKDQELSFQSDIEPQLFIKGMHVLSSKISDITQMKNNTLSSYWEQKSFNELRNEILFNIKTVSDYFINIEYSQASVDWMTFFDLINGLRQYNDYILEYRKRIDLPISSALLEKNEYISPLKAFEEQLGADGLTNNQWMTIMEAGGGPIAHEKIARQSKANMRVISQMKKQKTASVDVGELEEIKPFSRTIEDIKYTYYSQPPRQLSFAYDNDLNLLIGLTDWIISINAGRPAALSEVFRIGLNNKLNLYEDYVIGSSVNNRKVIDSQGNSVSIMIDKRYINKDSFWGIPINKVLIMEDNVIKFIRQKPNNTSYGNKEVVVVSIVNIEGTLLKRIKNIIKSSKSGNIDINTATLKLK